VANTHIELKVDFQKDDQAQPNTKSLQKYLVKYCQKIQTIFSKLDYQQFKDLD